jgi:hypothetical protein
MNGGVITGEVRFGNAADTIEDTGSILQNLYLGDGPNSHTASGNGAAAGHVLGRSGNDDLFGANMGNRFDGGADADRLYDNSSSDSADEVACFGSSISNHPAGPKRRKLIRPKTTNALIRRRKRLRLIFRNRYSGIQTGFCFQNRQDVFCRLDWFRSVERAALEEPAFANKRAKPGQHQPKTSRQRCGHHGSCRCGNGCRAGALVAGYLEVCQLANRVAVAIAYLKPEGQVSCRAHADVQSEACRACDPSSDAVVPIGSDVGQRIRPGDHKVAACVFG